MVQMLRMHVSERQINWGEVVPLVLAAYRAMRQETTGQTPNMLMKGREINFPVYLLAGRQPGEKEEETTASTVSSSSSD